MKRLEPAARAQGMEVNAIAAALFEVGLEALQFRLGREWSIKPEAVSRNNSAR